MFSSAVSGPRAAARLVTWVVVLGWVSGDVGAQTWPAGVAPGPAWTATALGVPPVFAAVAFNASGSNFYLGTGAGSSVGLIYRFNVTRDPVTLKVIALTAPTPVVTAPGIDGGMYLANGLIYWTTYPNNLLGELNVALGQSVTFPLPPALSSTGGLTFIPSGLGYPNAGTLLVSSYGSGNIYAIPLSPSGTGGAFAAPGTEVLYAQGSAGKEGLAFITTGPLAGKLAVADYGSVSIKLIDINPATGTPVGGPTSPSVTSLITGLPAAEGLACDPVTGDLFLSTWALNTVQRIDGIGTMTTLSVDRPMASVGGGVAIRFFLRAGSARAGRLSLLAATLSGTSPGLDVGPVHIPLNYDSLTQLVLDNLNTPLFTNFFGPLDTNGASVATVNLPPFVLPGPVPLDFAAVLLNPLDFATNAPHVVLVP